MTSPSCGLQFQQRKGKTILECQFLNGLLQQPKVTRKGNAICSTLKEYCNVMIKIVIEIQTTFTSIQRCIIHTFQKVSPDDTNGQTLWLVI